ncbi:Collagen alpha-4(VI) chain [Halotydeus destructor]|nr:Collagen alpha-4(VI) chain [Halotydeus destructor]
MDIVLVLDASGSIGASNFVLAKKFVADLTDNINLDTSRVALLVYDSSVYTIFGLANKLQRHHLRQSVLDVPYYNGGTSTDLALAAALNMFATTETRAGTVKIVSVFTDGQSNNPVDDAAERVRRSDVKAFGVGIGEGSSINDTELFILAGNETDRVFRLDNYQVLLESIKYLTKAVCDVQEPLPFDNVDIDVVSKGEKRYMKLKIREDVVIEAKNLTGRTRTFWSRTNPKPTSAVHDGEIIGRTLIKYKPKAERGRKRRNVAPVDEIDMDDIDVIYIGVEGLEERNNFTVVVTNNTDDYFETSTAATVEGLVTEDDTVTTVMSIRLREHEMRASEHQLTMSKLRWEAMYWKARLQREFPDVALGSSGVDKGWLTVATYGPVVKGK